eukprot:scaffold118243_cov59-Cyclotella_meneghiniana.AAC.3
MKDAQPIKSAPPSLRGEQNRHEQLHQSTRGQHTINKPKKAIVGSALVESVCISHEHDVVVRSRDGMSSLFQSTWSFFDGAHQLNS